ncbi:alpha/beta fold hydrolase [Halobium salinum]|uniref:Alpha/beta fold hydrolase n=1 Tax=Halobium salinum TaxID=1364940 RepID=A0ABD5PEY8_9EURY|nr:alpha/beta hydrolase [Halobium salinum]
MTLPDGWSTGTLRTNGIDLRYYRTGDPTEDAPTVVMAHGFYDGGLRWVPLAEALADDYDVVTYDARGHGKSDAPEDGYGIEDRVGDLVGLVRGLEIEDPVLVGHSMGAATVAWAAAEHPSLPRALVLEDPIGMHDTPDVSPDEMAGVVSERLDAVADATVDELVAEHYEEWDEAQARRLATATTQLCPRIAEIAREGYPKPLRAVFPDITAPTLILRSDGDDDRRTKDGEAVESLADGRLARFDDAGHYVLNDAFDAALDEVRAFLERV